MSSWHEGLKMVKRYLHNICFVMSLLLVFAGISQAGTWKEDFERLCGYTEEASSLSTDQIQELIQESDRLLKTLETVNEPEKKVYIFRLKKCRNFFEYILDLREAENNPEDKSSSPQ